MRKSRRGVFSPLKVVAVVIALSWPPAVFADFKVPSLTGPVVDNAGLLSSSMQSQLTVALTELSQSGVAQMAILTVPDLGGETIEQASIKVTDKWKLGTAAKDNGVLLMVSRGDRKVRIEVGQGLEGDFPDAYARRVIDDSIVPAFRNQDYEGGILLGTKEILEKVAPQFAFSSYFSGRTLPVYQRPHVSFGEGLLWLLILKFGGFGLLILFIILFRGGGGRRGGPRYWSGGGWSSGGWGGGSSGGWGGGFSGGGGGFSGGGASGNW